MSAKNEASKRNSAQGKKNAAARGAKGAEAAELQEGRAPVLDGGMRDDLAGIALAVIGIILFVAVVIPSEAPATLAIASGLKHAFGLGAYILPFAFVIWGTCCFLRTSGSHVGRLVSGLMIIVVAVMALLSLFNAGTNDAWPRSLFDDDVLIGGGGYVGSGIAWALMTPFGRIIAAIILGAAIVAGLVLVGVSVSAPLFYLKNLLLVCRRDRREASEYEASANFAAQQSFDLDDYDNDGEYAPESDTTFLFGNKLRFPLTHKRRGRRSGEAGADTADATIALSADDPSQTVDLSGDPGATVALGPGADGGPDGAGGPSDPSASDPSASGAAEASANSGSAAISGGTKKGGSKRKVAKTKRMSDAAGPTALEGFELPLPGMLSISGKRKGAGTGELRNTADLLKQTLDEFNVPADVVGWLAGPTVTMFKVDLPSGVRLARLVGLADDIALSLAAPGVRIAQIPNTSLVGVEIPNRKRANVLLGDVISNAGPGPLQMAIGEDVDGNKICLDLAKMPHLLVGGTTGSGKSVALNGMIMTILMRATPAEVRMILIDPKRVEFSLYSGIPHLFVPPITEPKEAASSLKWAVAEMERRLKLFEGVGARNIGSYNKMIQNGELTDEDGNHPDEICYIVIVIDELSDLMMVAGKEVEDSIVRISQLARAAGIHLIVATQRPSANVVTGMIKANITNRIALTVSQSLESRVIIDQSGAEKLTGHGDMLFSRPEWGKPKRIQGCYVSEGEISSVVAHLKAQGEPEYHNEILKQQVGGSSAGGGHAASTNDDADDPLLWDAADAVVAAGLGSTSMLQRRLKVGYARAGRIMDMLEAKGVVGPQDGSRAREVLIDSVEDLEAIRAFEEHDEQGGR